MDLEIINKLYLELSQVATATTARELKFQNLLEQARKASTELCYAIEDLPDSRNKSNVARKSSALRFILYQS